MKMLRGAAVAAAIAGSMLSVNAQAVNLATDGIGEVAIAPYYTVRDGWQTLINLTNTTDVPIVVKVRIHEGTNSRDVYDFNVGLSAFDVFTGAVRENADGNPVWVALDQANDDGNKSCTAPQISASGTERSLNPLGFSGGAGDLSSDDGGLGGDSNGSLTADASNRLKEGYIEFVVMGYGDPDLADAADPAVLTAPSIAAIDANKDGAADFAANAALVGAINIARAIEQHDCANFETAFNNATNAATGVPYILDTARQLGEPVNALKFNFRLLNAARGVEAGNSATTWANFYSGTGAHPADVNGVADGVVQPFENATAGFLCTTTRGDYRETGLATDLWTPNGAANGSCGNLATAQTPFAFLEPSLNDAFPAVANWWDDSANAVRTIAATAASVNTGKLAGLGRVRGVDAVSATIQRSAIVNEWSSNPAQGVSTDWIVTMPTKSFYVDQGTGVQFGVATDNTGNGNAPDRQWGRPEACIGVDLNGAVDFIDFDPNTPTVLPGIDEQCEPTPYAPFRNNFAQTTPNNRASAKSCNEVTFGYYDRAEQTPTVVPGGVIESPAPPPVSESDFLCYEANVVTFNGNSALSPANPVNVNTVINGVTPAAGWMFMSLASTGNGLEQLTSATTYAGLPVIGAMLKQRNFGDVTKNFASSLDHGYLRTLTP